MSQQLKKLLYDKKFVDNGKGESIAEWRLSTIKVFLLFITIAVSLVIVYGFLFTEGQNQQNFFGNMIFYSVVICLAIGILWIVTRGIIKLRKLIVGFMIAFILLLVFYWFLGFLFEYANLMNFQMGGHALWILLVFLAGLGAKRIDGELDRNDVGYGFLVMIVMIGANIPIIENQGFLATFDNFILNNLFNVIGHFI